MLSEKELDGLNDTELKILAFVVEGEKNHTQIYKETNATLPDEKNIINKCLDGLLDKNFLIYHQFIDHYSIVPPTTKTAILSNFKNGFIQNTVFDLMLNVSKDLPELILTDFVEALNKMKDKEILHDRELCESDVFILNWEANDIKFDG